MKKITYILVLFIISITLVNAKSCTVITGTGKNIGDEIACGTENFYVVSNDGTNVKMLGKYNLLTKKIYDYYEVENFEFRYRNEIYKNKKIQDRINKTGIIVDVNEHTWNDSLQKYQATSVSGVGQIGEEYKIVVFENDLENYQQILKDKQVIEMLNSGYKIYELLQNSSDSNYYGIFFVKHENYEYKTIILNGDRKTEVELVLSKEVSEVIEEGYRIDSYLRDNYESIHPRTYYDYYAVTFVKEKGANYKLVTFDDGMTKTKEEIMKKEEVQKIMSQGYAFTNYTYYYTSTTSNYKTYYDYYAIMFVKNENIERKTILLDGTFRTYNELRGLADVKTLINQGYSVENSYYHRSTYSSGEYRYDYYAVTLKKETEIEFDGILQNEKAIGINGDVNGPNYPIYGVIYYDDELTGMENEYPDGAVYGGGYYQDFDISSHSYLSEYKESLISLGFSIKEVSTLSVSELNEITKIITGKEIPLIEWYENKKTANGEEWRNSYVLGNLKQIYTGEYADKYSWIWGTSYWLRTSNEYTNYYDINTMGDLCLSDMCNDTPSRGFRPLVTISSKDIEYNIETKTDGNGTIETTHTEAQNGEQIKFTISPKKGYILKEVKVTDAEGNVLTFKDYTFTMPSSSVTIEAIFEIENPNTKSINFYVIMLFTLIVLIVVIANYKKMKLIYE